MCSLCAIKKGLLRSLGPHGLCSAASTHRADHAAHCKQRLREQPFRQDLYEAFSAAAIVGRLWEPLHV